MIITDKFVMLNFPKTGSSFARKALKEIYEKNDTPLHKVLHRFKLASKPLLIELIQPRIDEIYNYGIKDQHGTYRQIPEQHRHKPIVSVTRNPFDRYVSRYLTGWWKRHPPADIGQVKKYYPLFPELSFKEYYELYNLLGRENRLNGISPKIELGFQTIHFIQFYFKEPMRIPEIVFLHQDNLNQELYEFLLSVGHPEKAISFILEADKVNVTPRKHSQRDLSSFYSQSLMDDVYEKDKLLFDLFPEFKYSLIGIERAMG